MNSHIQMPRFMLRRFENEDHKLFYHDIEKKIIASGFPKTINTEEGYYSPDAEDLLNQTIERPFSKILQYLDGVDFDTEMFSVPADFSATVKAFLNSLLVRSPNTYKSMMNHSVLLPLVNPSVQVQHDLTIMAGIDGATKLGLFDDYTPTFTVNKPEYHLFYQSVDSTGILRMG